MWKRLSWVIFISLLISGSMAQEKKDSSHYQRYYYGNGKVSSEGFLVDGQPDGYWKSYSPEGVLISEGNRKNFLLDSLWKFYSPTGTLSLSIYYKEGKKEGERVEFFPDEFVVEQWRRDTLQSPVTAYFLDSTLKRTTPYREGKLHGLEKEFDPEGKVIAVTNYYRGVLTRKEFINRTDNFGYKQGNWKYFWDNGNLKLEGSYRNDKKEGFFKYYDEAGNFTAIEKYENDRLLADAEETKVLDRKVNYHPNGQPKTVATFYKGVPEGIRREFDTAGKVIQGYIFEHGVLRFEGITDLEGKRQGAWKEYFPTGETRWEGNYRNSLPVGKWRFYFPDQTVEMSGQYTGKGEKTGEWVWRYPDGSTLRIENYEAGELEGPFVEYDEQGEPIAQGEYVAGERDGEWQYLHHQVVEKGHYYDGYREGVWKTWFPNGTLSSEMTFDMDIPAGKFTYYWENGKSRMTGKYDAGERTGTWYRYDENGNLILSIVYRNGKEEMWNSYIIDK